VITKRGLHGALCFFDLADCGLRIRRSEISNKKPVKSGMRGDDSQVIEKAAKINVDSMSLLAYAV
jgi:hypothetical protein